MYIILTYLVVLGGLSYATISKSSIGKKRKKVKKIEAVVPPVNTITIEKVIRDTVYIYKSDTENLPKENLTSDSLNIYDLNSEEEVYPGE